MDVSQILPKQKIASAAPYYELIEGDQLFPAGMYRLIATGDTLDFQRATATDWSTSTSLLTLSSTSVSLGVTSGFGDDVLFTLGAGNDIVMLNRSTTLAADTTLANVLEGTVEAQAIAANSLMLANITNNGDLAFYISKAGSSQMVFWADGSSGDTALLAASGQSVDFYVAGTKIVDVDANGISVGTTNGIDINPGSDTDADLITVGVTGAPKIWWDESENTFVTDNLIVSTYLTVGQATLATGQAFTVTGDVVSSGSLWIGAAGTFYPGTGGVVARSSNQATMNMNIPVSGADATTHDIDLQIDSNSVLMIRGTGDGGGGAADLQAIFSGKVILGAETDLTIASGAVTVTKSYHSIVVEGGAGSGADSLDSAAGGAEGMLLVLKPNTSGAADQVTITDGTGAGAFILSGGVNFVMDHVDDRIMFIHNGTEWVEMSRSSNS